MIKAFLKGGIDGLLSLIPPRKSLRRKTLLSIGVFFSLTMLFTAVWVDHYFRQQTMVQVVAWQSSVLGALVKDTDARFKEAQRAIVALARELSNHTESLVRPEEARRILKFQTDMSEIFDNGVVLISSDGKVHAEYPYISGWEGADLSQRDFFQLCSEELNALISRPYICKNSGKPVVMVSAPLFDKNGKKIGVVGGSLRLTNPEIFFQSQQDGSNPQGAGGYFYIMDAERTMLYHPDASRIMQRDVPRGANKLLDAALEEGFEGSGETVNSRGVRQLVSFGHLQSTGWVVAVVSPIEDVFAPITKFRWLYGTFIIIVLGCGLIVTYFVTRNITANLEGIVTQLHQFPVLPRQERRLFSTAADESTPIAEAVNQLLEEIEIENERIIESKIVAEEANAAKSRFLANISHELRTPLHGIIGLTQLCMESNLNPQQREYLDGILSSGKSLTRLLNDLLDTAKIDSGKLTLECCHFNFCHLVKDISRLQRQMAEQKGMTFNTTIDQRIPERLKGDPKRLRQVLNNLVSNAIKFSHNGTVTMSVSLLERRGEMLILCFTVKDEGIGISADKVDMIFDPFVQAEGDTTRRFGGTGLGLTICRQLVELMGGDISVSTVVGEGSTFSFCLPLFTVQETAIIAGEDAIPQRMSSGTESCSSEPAVTAPLRTVLIVEDVALNRRIAQKTLEGEGYRVLCAGDGVEAIEIWQREKIDVILMDVQMPNMDGLQATRIIRQQEQQTGERTPIVALTAGSSLIAHDICIDSGMDDALVKPYDIDALRSLLGKIFQQSDHEELTQSIAVDREDHCNDPTRHAI